MRPLAIGLLLTISACNPDAHEPLGARQQETDLQVLQDVPEFSFMERSGKPLTRDDLLGKVWVASFIFTNCKTACITMSIEMNSLQEDFVDQPDFRIVATSVDPERDTLEVLDKFGKTYEADPEKWLFLRGDKEKVREFAHHGLKIAWHDDDPLIHSVYFVLVDRQGRVRGYYQQTDGDRMDKLREDITALLAEKTP